MNFMMRTCTLVSLAAAAGLACGDDGNADTSDTNPVTSISEPTTPSEATVSSATEPPTPTTGDATTAAAGTQGSESGPTTDTPPTGESGETGVTTVSTGETGVTTASTGETTDTASSTGGGTCAQGDIVCDGGTAKVCDGNGGFESEQPCVAACAPDLGCVACIPGEGQCVGDLVQVCKPDGSGYDDGPTCDGLIGLACDPQLGQCAGPCAELGGLSYIGCDYYPVVTAQLDNFIDDNPFAVGVANTSADVATVTVTQGGQTIATVDVAPNSVELLILPWVDDLVLGNGPSTIAPDGAYRLRATRPVTVYQYNPLNADITNDASLLLPVNTWTGNYVVASWQFWQQLGNAGIYSVTASQDDTTVTVTPPNGGTPTQPGDGIDAMGHGEVVLDAGDVLQVFVASGGDSTGTLIHADKPIQVLGGHECTQVPIGTNACDHLEESMFPVETLAKEYFVVPPVQVPDDTKLKAIVVRVIASEPATTLTFQPDLPVNKLLADAGDFVEIAPTTQRFVVTSDKKILVAQYMVGQGGGFGTSDPDMVLAVPSEQFRDNYLVFAETGWQANYVDVIAPAGASVQVDGMNVAGFVPIGNTGFSHTHHKLSNAGDGRHAITADQQIGVSVYGVVNFGSYWYPGGLDLKVVPQ